MTRRRGRGLRNRPAGLVTRPIIRELRQLYEATYGRPCPYPDAYVAATWRETEPLWPAGLNTARKRRAACLELLRPIEFTPRDLMVISGEALFGIANDLEEAGAAADANAVREIAARLIDTPAAEAA